MTKIAWAALAAPMAMLGYSAAQGQASPSEHASHHPSAAAPSADETPKADTIVAPPRDMATSPPGGGMTDMMKEMMSPSSGESGAAGCCGIAGGKPFYPTMMNMPAPTRETRAAIRTEAVARLGSGAAAITAGQADLHHAQASNDLVAAQVAINAVRDGVSLAESGNSALRGLNQDQAPPRIAQTWFKREMSVTPDSDMFMGGGFRGLSWLHLAAMLLLAAALVAALLLRRARLQRIGALADRLTKGSQPPGFPSAGMAAPSGIAGATGAPPGPSAASPPVKRPWKGVLRIKAIFDETPTVKTFRLMEPNMGAIPFSFLPGQYASITSEIDGKKVRRSYTIASSPTQRDYIELTVKREDHGLESRHLHDHAETGDLLEIIAPAGNFFFTGKEADGIVLIAGGVGITPMMSVLRNLTDRSYPHEIHLIYGVRTPADLIFREECAYLAKRHPNVTILSIVSSAEGTDWAGPVGFITADFIAGCIDDIAKRRIHLCGPPPMMDAVKAALAELHVPPDQVKTEDFAPPKGGPVPDQEPEDEAPALPADVVGGGSADGGAAPPSAQATVNFSKSGKSGNLSPDQSVLEAAEAIGVVIDFECRVGTCGRCKVPLTEGTVTMEVEDALSADEKAAGTILACQAKSPSNLVVDA